MITDTEHLHDLAAARVAPHGGIAPGADAWGFLARYWHSMADLLQFLMLRERARAARPRGIAPGADAWHMIAEERAGACRKLAAECQEWRDRYNALRQERDGIKERAL